MDPVFATGSERQVEMTTEIRKPYGPRRRVQVEIVGESLTKQSMKAECDINNILAKYKRTGVLEHIAAGQPKYLDISEVGDYRTAIEQVRAVGEFFDGLPAEMRIKFNNDPVEFIDFVTDPANRERMVEYGLATASEARGDGDVGGDVGAADSADSGRANGE